MGMNGALWLLLTLLTLAASGGVVYLFGQRSHDNGRLSKLEEWQDKIFKQEWEETVIESKVKERMDALIPTEMIDPQVDPTGPHTVAQEDDGSQD